MNTMRGDGNESKSNEQPVPKKRGPGRPPIVREKGKEIISNGLYQSQWDWIKDFAASKGIDGNVLLREYIVRWYIDAVEASRADTVATPEQDEDFDRLIRSKTRSKKSKKPNKSNK